MTRKARTVVEYYNEVLQHLDTSNFTVDKKLRHRKNMACKGRCTLCPPHRGENKTNYKRSPKKPKRKDKRRA